MTEHDYEKLVSEFNDIIKKTEILQKIIRKASEQATNKNDLIYLGSLSAISGNIFVNARNGMSMAGYTTTELWSDSTVN